MTNQTAVIFAEDSRNAKITGYKGGKVSTTYASIKGSCPSSCKLQDTKECYAMLGPTGVHVNRLDLVGVNLKPLDIAKQEAQAIGAAFNGGLIPQDGLRGGRELRIHTAGDCQTDNAAKVLAGAVDSWYLRGGGKVWTYTHAWLKVKRASWGKISVLASLDNHSDAKSALDRGYSPARIVPEHRSSRAYEQNGIKWIPCPAQTSETIGCADCRLCFDAVGLNARKTGIDFAVHGVKRAAMRKRLNVLQNPTQAVCQ